MPQLNPEFFASQIFWLVVTFSFLLLFLWRISLPRISSVLERREGKINNDLESAKQLQDEAEEIQSQIEDNLRKVREETTNLIKDSTSKLQNQTTEELIKVDNKLNKKFDEFALEIKNRRKESHNLINNQIYEITKLMLSKLSSIPINDTEIKEFVDKAQTKASL